MAKASISFHTQEGFNREGGRAQVLRGSSEEPRIDVVTAAGWPVARHAQVPDRIRYLEFYTEVPCLIYTGPSNVAADWEAKAVARPAGWWPVRCAKDDSVAIREIG
jgi:hypothetical protein